mmetsp:Transcript_4386/g.5212  ORF Transcript_4386/g.5212 Transcript_4386/m.5212 type:complete len:93 (-) Transcript_4386:873-1151(-)
MKELSYSKYIIRSVSAKRKCADPLAVGVSGDSTGWYSSTSLLMYSKKNDREVDRKPHSKLRVIAAGIVIAPAGLSVAASYHGEDDDDDDAGR